CPVLLRRAADHPALVSSARHRRSAHRHGRIPRGVAVPVAGPTDAGLRELLRAGDVPDVAGGTYVGRLTVRHASEAFVKGTTGTAAASTALIFFPRGGLQCVATRT